MDDRAFAEGLAGAGLIIPTGTPGLVLRGQAFEAVVSAIRRLVSAAGADEGALAMELPPLMRRRDLEKSGYLASFPHLAGAVLSFCGDEPDHRRLLEKLRGGDTWHEMLTPTDVCLCPAACYPLYPIVGARGLGPRGDTFEVEACCFRHEPSQDPFRMQSFRMREFVRIGAADDVLAFRERWLERGDALGRALGLPFTIQPANDPFFGRSGALLAQRQRAVEAKWELLVEADASRPPVACMSFNYHQDRFGETWNLVLAGGAVAHSGCVGFGLERLALALFRVHGLDPRQWPEAVQVELAAALS